MASPVLSDRDRKEFTGMITRSTSVCPVVEGDVGRRPACPADAVHDWLQGASHWRRRSPRETISSPGCRTHCFASQIRASRRSIAKRFQLQAFGQEPACAETRRDESSNSTSGITPVDIRLSAGLTALRYGAATVACAAPGARFDSFPCRKEAACRRPSGSAPTAPSTTPTSLPQCQLAAPAVTAGGGLSGARRAGQGL